MEILMIVLTGIAVGSSIIAGYYAIKAKVYMLKAMEYSYRGKDQLRKEVDEVIVGKQRRGLL